MFSCQCCKHDCYSYLVGGMKSFWSAHGTVRSTSSDQGKLPADHPSLGSPWSLGLAALLGSTATINTFPSYYKPASRRYDIPAQSSCTSKFSVTLRRHKPEIYRCMD